MDIRKIILCILLYSSSTLLFAQNNAQFTAIENDDSNYIYGEIIGRQAVFGLLNVRIDTGQTIIRTSGRGQPKDGSKLYPYESFVAALNEIRSRGWRLVGIYNWPAGDSIGEIRWVIRRSEGE